MAFLCPFVNQQNFDGFVLYLTHTHFRFHVELLMFEVIHIVMLINAEWDSQKYKIEIRMRDEIR